MDINHFNLALPVVALAVVLGLLVLLRRLLRVRDQESNTSATGQAIAVATANTAVSRDPWHRITAHWNPWITQVLPVPVGICILALTVWVLAYVGWAATWVLDRPDAMAGVPPWFGSAGLFVKNVLYGFATLFLGVAAGFVLVIFSHLIGKCLIWPEACGCEDDGKRRR